MTKYCIRCLLPFEGERCPVCRRKADRTIRQDDMCFLSEKEQVWSGMLADVLKQNGIPFTRKGSMGAGLALKVGPMFESFRFYVLYEHLDKARELVEELFSSEAEDDSCGNK
ncbi:MAG: hypothetical protein J5933_02480 [Clostridia bacterium]|nr:hypothetical protein [Clostridia bacterium]